MAHIEKRTRKGRVTYRARYRDPAGREKARVFNRRVDAQRFLTEVENSKLRGTWTDPALGRVQFHEWLAEWWSTTTNLRPSTRARDEMLLRRYACHASATSRLPPSGSASSGPGSPTSPPPSWHHPPSARPTTS
jgi:hypothetical protein